MSDEVLKDKSRYRLSRLLLALALTFLCAIAGRFFEHGQVLPSNLALLGPSIGKVLYTVAWCLGILVVARLVDVLVWDGIVEGRTGVRVPGLLRQVGVMILVIVGALGMFSSVYGIPISALVTASGALGIVVGLAFKDILSDFFSGIVLNLEKPFWLDEWISIGGGAESTMGCVKEINWRSTRLVTAEKNLIVVRNADFLTAKIVNYSRPVVGAEFEAEVCLGFLTDPGLIETVFEAAASEAASSKVILSEPAPKHYLKAINADGLTYIFAYSIDLRRCSRKAARDVVLSIVARHLRCSGIEPPTAKEVRVGRLPVRTRYTGTFTDQILRLLQQVELLRVLTDAELADLAEKINVKKYPAGEAVVRGGEEGSSMFVLVAGHLEVSVKPGDSEDSIRVATLGPGDFFGEMSLLTGESRTATVSTLVPSVLYEITHETVAGLIESRPALADELSRVAAERRLRNEEVATVSSRPPSEVAHRRESLIVSLSLGIAKFFSRGR